MVERLTRGDGLDRRGHEFRYRLAAGFCTRSSRVLDAACGTGYGREFFDCHYVGVDRSLEHLESRGWFVEADLETWQPRFAFDVFVSFETIEHLEDHSNLIAIAHRARHWIIMSAPIVPTVGINPHHRHDLQRGDLERLLTSDDWELYQTLQQPMELAEIVIMRSK